MKPCLSFLLAAFCASVAFAADPVGNPPASAAAADASQAINTVCPVSGDPVGSVGKRAYAEYHGKRIAFCCRDCVKKFHKNPDKYGALAEKNQSADEGT
jgi:YHS domain-containing protein